jgi:hypothetical protein
MVVKRPTGHKLIDQAISATITEAYGGGALVTFTAHGLSDGNTIYIDSDINEYNGFWYVTVVSVDTFKISEHSEADFVEYFQDADIDYYQTQDHDWSSIFLPIVYKVTNVLWPVNTIDPTRTVSSSANDNGFTELTLSGALRGSVNSLEFVWIAGATDDDLNGVWQVVEVLSTSHIVINLPYSASNSFAGATIQYYYNNFQQKVKIYAGLPSDHPWEAQKPFEEVAELSLTPDENNEVMFSVSDYIKSKVKIENNLTLYSLPLNLDAFTGFYIATAMTYDQSDNYSLYTTDPLYMDDDFVGYAVTGKLPFKNVYSGDYADYVYASGYPALWLTNRDRLLGVEGYFFDVSFIKNIVGDFYLSIKKYLSSDYYIEETLSFDDFGIGVYRIPLTLDANYNAWCITANTEDRTEEQTVDPEPDDLSAYTQTALGPNEYDWTIGETLSVNMTDDFSTEFVGKPKTVLNGVTLKINYNITIGFTNTHPLPVIIRITFYLDTSLASTDDQVQLDYNVPVVGSGTVNLVGSLNVMATSNRNFFDFIAITGADEAQIVINSISFGDSTTEEVEIPGVQITEEMCIDILEACDVQEGFVSTEGRRLLEDGGYRLLE